MSVRDVVIVGGGHNGLVAAVYLARTGRSVLVLERREIVGGGCVTEELFPGYKFATCASLCGLFRTEIIRDLQLSRRGLEFYAVQPYKLGQFEDERTLAYGADDVANARALAEFSVADAKVWPDLWKFWWQVREVTQDLLLHGDATSDEFRERLRRIDHPAAARLVDGSIAEVLGLILPEPAHQSLAGGPQHGGHHGGSVLAGDGPHGDVHSRLQR